MKFERPIKRSVVAWADQTGYPNDLVSGSPEHGGARAAGQEICDSDVHTRSVRLWRSATETPRIFRGFLG